MESLNQRNLCLTPWCNTQECEKASNERSKEESLSQSIKSETGEEILTGAAKTLCLPFETTPLK
jgi:hypothetical protein